MDAPSWVTAVATVGLAILTAVYVVVTKRIADRSAESVLAAKTAAEAAEESAASSAAMAKLARESLLLGVAPVVVPTSSARRGMTWTINAKNRGAGIAFGVDLSIVAGGETIGGPVRAVNPIPPSEAGEVYVEAHALTPDGTNLWLQAEYGDLYGNRYRVKHCQMGPDTGRTITSRLDGDTWIALQQVIGEGRTGDEGGTEA